MFVFKSRGLVLVVFIMGIKKYGTENDLNKDYKLLYIVQGIKK